MYAIIQTGGKQYRVSPGDSIEVEKLPQEVGEKVELSEVLMVTDGASVRVGQPVVEGAKVRATVTHQAEGRKVIIFKYHNKNRYRRRLGHRQQQTWLQIDEIIA